MTRHLLALTACGLTLAACDTTASGPADTPADTPAVVDGRLVFENMETFGAFVTESKAQETPVLEMLEWGDDHGFRSLLHESVVDDDDDSAARRADAPVIGGYDPFIRTLLNPQGELQIGDQLLRVDATHATLYAADGSVVRRSLIDVRKDGARGADLEGAPAPQARVRDEEVVNFGPANQRVVQETRTLELYQFTARLYSENYTVYWNSGAFSRHEIRRKNFWRGYYYGASDADQISVSCSGVVRKTVDGLYVEYPFNQSDTETNAEGADITIDWTLATLTIPDVDASCTHYDRVSGFSRTLYTNI